MKWLLITVLLCAAILGVIAVFPRTSTQTVVNDTPHQISISTSTIKEQTPAYSITANYPVFGVPEVDAKIKQTIDAGIADIKTAEANPSPNGIQNEFISMFQKSFVDDSFISVELLLSQYTGGAHNNSEAVGVNFNRATKKFLTLDDALKLTGKSLKDLSVIAKNELTKQFDSVQFPEGIAPVRENFATFVVEKNAVRFIFQEYQVESFAMGMPEFRVPIVR